MDITVTTGTDYIEFHFNDLSTLAQLKLETALGV